MSLIVEPYGVGFGVFEKHGSGRTKIAGPFATRSAAKNYRKSLRPGAYQPKALRAMAAEQDLSANAARVAADITKFSGVQPTPLVPEDIERMAGGGDDGTPRKRRAARKPSTGTATPIKTTTKPGSKTTKRAYPPKKGTPAK